MQKADSSPGRDEELLKWEKDLTAAVAAQFPRPTGVELKLLRTTLTKDGTTKPVVELYLILAMRENDVPRAAVLQKVSQAIEVNGFAHENLGIVEVRGAQWGLNAWLQRPPDH